MEQESVAQDSPFDRACQQAREQAHTLYHDNLGFSGIHRTQILKDEDGQWYVRVCMKADGHCCCYALGITRASLLENMASYVDDGETFLGEVGTQGLQNAQAVLELRQVLLSTAGVCDAVAFGGHDFRRWRAIFVKNTMDIVTAGQTVTMNSLFDSLAAQQALPAADWGVVREKAGDLGSLIESVFDDVAPAIEYQEFVAKFVADISTRLGDNEDLAALDAHLRGVGVLDVYGKKLRPVSDADFPFRDQSDAYEKFFRYVRHMVEFATADAAVKKEIVTDFYGTQSEWVDPSSFMHVGGRFGIKAKLFKVDDGLNTLCFRAKTPDADIASGLPCRIFAH
jgi:hypothetical protein